MSCLSSGRLGVSKKKKGNEVLAQMVPQELVGFLALGQVAPSSLLVTIWEH